MPKPLIFRTKEMQTRYNEARAAHAAESAEAGGTAEYDPFAERLRQAPLRGFEYWSIVENLFPYDAVMDVHHLLVPHRKFARTHAMTAAEREELEAIKREIGADYHAMIENFPNIQSVPTRLHFHLVVWKARD